MEELITISENAVVYSPAIVEFPQYQLLKDMALALSERIMENSEVTEENIKETKKDLAAVRKITIELNNRRKFVKAEVLSQYNIFEAQVKEIDNIISEAEEVVRQNVKALEEAERESKKETIHELWKKRYQNYSISIYRDCFDAWLKPQHLNKSTAMSSVEKDMVEWLEQTEKDLITLTEMGKEYQVEYIKTLNINEAIRNVNETKKIESHMNESNNVEIEETAKFIIMGKKNIKLAQMLLEENEIEYRRI